MNDRLVRGTEQMTDTHLSQLASVGQIAAGIAHEVRNPLTAVKGFLQLMKEKGNDSYIDIAQNELNSALHTLENLLQVSKPDLENEPSQMVNLSVEIESILNLFQDQMYRIEIRKDIQRTDILIPCKKNQLKRVLFNLLKNAFEAIPDKGTIHIEHNADEDNAYVTIGDSGVGIPPNKLNLLGTPFFTTKEQGTGMGLTQVFSVIYQHGGNIHIESEVNVGTKVFIALPRNNTASNRDVIKLNLEHAEDIQIREFLTRNRRLFEQRLMSEAINVKDKINEIREKANIDLLANAHRLVLYIVDGREHEMIHFAKEEGAVWARVSLTLAFKLEWIQAIRRVLWDFLYNFELLNGTETNLEHFFSLEKKINAMLDQFVTYFFISYSQYKDNLLQSHRELVEDLSVPIIPLSPSICILPLIGNIDSVRARTIEEKVIGHLGIARTEILIIDFSGVAEMEAGVIYHMMRILDGISMMGSKTVITGIRPEVVKTMIHLEISFESKATTKGTLQQALVEYLQPNG